ncbi:MAG: hypothetical protein LBV76_02485 [Deltaproteobacteria bacterium]|nr:hypothetical protein [Deltaproteobacteria bacterium]
MNCSRCRRTIQLPSGATSFSRVRRNHSRLAPPSLGVAQAIICIPNSVVLLLCSDITFCMRHLNQKRIFFSLSGSRKSSRIIIFSATENSSAASVVSVASVVSLLWLLGMLRRNPPAERSLI